MVVRANEILALMLSNAVRYTGKDMPAERVSVKADVGVDSDSDTDADRETV
ncbi:hypothetical protein [Halegenticoccus soli]|uniref:hypothetical protein n=1 Tax=Halegenticoccus soli TaxID=1985678 RepID=UPI001E357285|nr:hypothetical protein [Halegenticoccus soli]